MLRALRAGTFFADLGHIVRQVEFTVEAEGLVRPAWPGEIIEVAAGVQVTASLSFVVTEEDWAGEHNQVDAIELVAITKDSVWIAANRPPNPDGIAFTERMVVPGTGLVLRARGRRIVENGPDLLFYTNPIRIIAR